MYEESPYLRKGWIWSCMPLNRALQRQGQVEVSGQCVLKKQTKQRQQQQ